MNEHSSAAERPLFSEKEVVPMLEENYGLTCTVKELPGERDRNYLVRDSEGDSYVLKISNAGESQDHLNAQISALECTAKLLEQGKDTPSISRKKMGNCFHESVPTTISKHWIRLVSYVDGITMAEYRPHTREFLFESWFSLRNSNQSASGYHHAAFCQQTSLGKCINAK